MKIYSDSNLTTEIKDLDFGIVLAGATKKVSYWLYNETDAEVVELKPSVANTEVKVLSCPDKVASKSSVEATFEWTPSITIKKGLKTELLLNFYELYS